MASLKEIRGRISSVSSTRKITSAMKMVSSAKLKKAQQTISNYLPYMEKMTDILESFVSAEDDSLLSFTEVRPLQRVAIVAFSSNSSLAGAFNSNVIKKLQEVLDSYKEIPSCNVVVYPIGKKVYDWVSKKNIPNVGLNDTLTEKPSYQDVSEIANQLMADFREKRIDKVEIIYNHFKNTAVQQIRDEALLPLTPIVPSGKKDNTDFIIEPNKQELVCDLIPKVIRLQLYGALLDSIASEHGARTTAMQIATDNADELIQDLNIQYNKMRQGAITTELLDIIGAADAV